VRTEKIRASIVTRAPRNVVRLAACGLEGTTSIGGHIRTLDWSVDGARCSPGVADPFSIEMRTEPIQENELRIVLEHDPTDGADEEVRDAFARITDELESRIVRTWKGVRAYEKPGSPARWYGWQTILVDASSALTAATIFGIPFAIAGFAFGPPIVHWAHGHVRRGFISLILRIAPPTFGLGVGTLIGLGVSCSEPAGCGSDTVVTGAAIGTAIGAVSAGVVSPIWDAIVSVDPAVRPVVLPAQGGAVFGFTGDF
jgi:hypothetical protein